MKHKNWKKVLLSWFLVLAMSLQMAGTVSATGIEQENTDEFVWTEEDPVASESLVTAETEPEETSDIAEDETVRVLIAFEDESAIEAGFSTGDIAANRKAASYADKLENKQEEITDKISEEALNGEELDVRYNFTLLANAVSADVAYGDVEKIEEVDGVAGVYVLPVYEVAASDAASPNTITAGDMVGSYNTWASGYSGAGQRIAVIDTGLDTDHPSFDGEAFDYGLAETAAEAGKTVADYDLLDTEEIASVMDSLNATAMRPDVTADDLFLNNKVAYAFNYVDEDTDVTHDNDGQGDHGTHVSGISTANQYVPAETGYEKQGEGVVGIAPDAQLMVMKVFGKNGGAYPDDYMAAIQDAIILGADVVNLSLGSSSAGSSKEYASAEQYINTIFDAITQTDTVVSISAGNAGYWSEESIYGANLASDVNLDTVGSPGSYTNAFTIASTTNSGYTGYCVQAGSADVYYDDAAADPFRSLDTSGSGTEYEYVFLDGFGAEEDYEGIDVTGKIAVVSRGEISFAEKHMYAELAGAAGLLIYNNTEGTISMSLEGSYAVIPCASITQADGAALKAEAAEANGVYTGTMTVYSTVSTNYNADGAWTMSDFSSMGVPGDLSLKPEITAPGGNIYSTLDNGEYGLMSGTSMSSPSVAGMSALAAEYIKENNLTEKTGLSVRVLTQSLLMSTSTPLLEEDGEEYSPRKQGSGFANIEYATTTPAYILMKENGTDGKVKAELGDDPERTGVYSFGFTVYNMSEEEQYFTTDSSILTEEAIADEDGFQYICGTSYKLNPSVAITSSRLEKKYDLNADGKVDEADAQMLLACVNGSAESEKALSDIFDLNADGVVNTADVYNFLLEINGTTSALNLNEEVIAVKDSAEVNVTVTLSNADKEYLNSNFENGMYVDGFIYLNGDVTLSVPMLAFYGNWADASMYEPFDYLEFINNGDFMLPYTGVMTNYLTYKFKGDSSTYLYNSNLYVEDDTYIPERNAISSTSGDSIKAFNYSLIRNASDVTVSITNAETGEVYLENQMGALDAAFYYANGGNWENTSYSAPLNWTGTDANGNPLPEGTKVNITVTALPSYYDDWTGTDVPGKGVSMTVPMTIDNTKPERVSSTLDAANSTMDVTVKDNQYVAAVAVYERDKTTLVDAYAINQTEAGVESTVTIDIPESVFYVAIIDYAGNQTLYRVNNSGAADTEYTDGVTLDQTSIALLKGDSQKLVATVGPETVLDDTVTWKSSDEAVATVDENGVVTAVSVGNATITATTNAKNASGIAEEASCDVTVETLSIDLGGILWDEDGKVFWTKFNSSNTTDLQKVSGEQGNDYMAATTVGDKLLAATCGEQSAQISDLYLVDPANGYAATPLTSVTWCTDLTYSDTFGLAIGTYGPMIQILDPAAASVNDISLGTVDLSSVTGGEYLVGIAYAGYISSEDLDCYYVLGETGNMYLFYMNSSLQMGMELIENIGVDTNDAWYFSSMYYDYESGYILVSLFNGGSSVLYAVNENTLKCTELGAFPNSVWPVAALYCAGDFATGASTTTAERAAGVELKDVTLSKEELPKLEVTVPVK